MNLDPRIAVIGLGYVGLPLAVAFAEAGLQVEGVDVSDARIAELAGGRSPRTAPSTGRVCTRPPTWSSTP